MLVVIPLLLCLTSCVFASPNRLVKKQLEGLSVHINSVEDFCLILPKNAYTDIGASEHPGGMSSYCTIPQETSGNIPVNFWQPGKVELSTTATTGRSIQLTGCIDPGTTDRVNALDTGGQYDSNGGLNGQGNPAGSVCSGYGSYIEIVEPAANRACIRCCDDPYDCPLTQDTEGCPAVIPGNYFDCGN